MFFYVKRERLDRDNHDALRPGGVPPYTGKDMKHAKNGGDIDHLHGALAGWSQTFEILA